MPIHHTKQVFGETTIIELKQYLHLKNNNIPDKMMKDQNLDEPLK